MKWHFNGFFSNSIDARLHTAPNATEITLRVVPVRFL